MKKILFSVLIIGAVSAVVIGGTLSFFSDTETSAGNTFTAGTIEIGVNGQLHWSDTFEWADIKPGKDFEIEFEVVNEGLNPLKLWKIIKCLETDENGIIEPEQAWYDDNSVTEKNDIDTAIIYEMEVDGNTVIGREAGITMSQIKDSYIGLVSLDQSVDPSYTGPETNGTGILNPGGSIIVTQRYFMPEDVENWAQSDKMTFVMEIEARQLSAPEPLQQMAFMENKFVSGDWHAIVDEKMGILKYDYMAPEFDYNFFGVGLDPNTQYCLIYYADPWGSQGSGLTGQTGFLIDQGTPESNGELALSDNKNIGTDLPNVDDDNYPTGAKIWLLPCSQYDIPNHHLIGWNPNNSDWLFDNWPGFINYKQGDRPDEELNCGYENGEGENNENPDTSELKTIVIDNVISSTDWTGDSCDYSLANVEFSYQDPGENNRLSGTVTATGLKPYTTYQVKFIGKPECEYGTDGNDAANEYIGHEGRWTVLNVACSGAGCNRTDALYEANELLADTNPSKECIAGYLVWDFFTTDSSGNAVKAVSTDNSYHVLRCNGGVCGLISDSQLQNTDGSSPPGYPYCDAGDVEGERELDSTPGRAACGGLTLDLGSYDLKIVLTEESFHKSAFGTWTSVLDKDIAFEIE